jgi:ferredoxin-NADP reductase
MNAAVGLYKPLDEMAPWDATRQVLEVIGIVDEAPGVKTFRFRSDNQTWFRYKPGQFITLELPVEGGSLPRTYTLSSSPSRPFSIAVTAKLQEDSIGTRWMFDHLKAGDLVRACGPAGMFSLHNYPAAKYLFISAGSGITPMMSMLRWLNDCSPQTDVAFVHSARRPEEIIFRRELELLSARMPNLSLGFTVSQRSSREGWFGHTGHIDTARLPLLAPDFRERKIFCCGPEPFMRAIREILALAGFDMDRFHLESFVTAPATTVAQNPIEALRPPPADMPAEAGMPIRFSSSEVDAPCIAGQTVLQTARATGVHIPSVCEMGLCGTCKVKKISGEVEMHHNGGILEHEIAEGYILACCSKPLSALEIEA